MKRLFIFLVTMMICAMINAQTSGGNIVRKQQKKVYSHTNSSTGKIYVVKNIKEFLNAIGSNRTIVLDSPTPLEATEEMVNRLNAGSLLEFELVDPHSSGLYADWGDGPGIVLANIQNLTIKGKNNNAELTIESCYCPVVRMVNCSNITFEQIILGHNTGTCGAPVIELEKCNNLTFSSCGLFGCGTEGFMMEDCNNIRCNNSNIYQCSQRISTIKGLSKTVSFTRCKIFDIRGGLVVEKGVENVLFEGCDFKDIDGDLFKTIEAPVSFHKCTISHDRSKLGSTTQIIFSDCIWN